MEHVAGNQKFVGSYPTSGRCRFSLQNSQLFRKSKNVSRTATWFKQFHVDMVKQIHRPSADVPSDESDP